MLAYLLDGIVVNEQAAVDTDKSFNARCVRETCTDTDKK